MLLKKKYKKITKKILAINGASLVNIYGDLLTNLINQKFI